jgi:hypothetical protein
MRSALAADLALFEEVQAAYDHVPNELGNQSPSVTVSSEGGPLTRTPAEGETVYLEVGVWIIREADPAAAEALLDTLRQRLKDLVHNKYNGDFRQESEADYVEMDGVSWRVEFHHVSMWRP